MNNPIPTHQSFAHALRFWASEYPNRLAFKFLSSAHISPSSYTYFELDRITDAIAESLSKKFSISSTVLIQTINEEETILAFLGAIKAGMVPKIAQSSGFDYSDEQADIQDLNCQITTRNSSSPILVVDSQSQTTTPYDLNIRTLSNRLVDFLVAKQKTHDPAYIQQTSPLNGIPRDIVTTHGELNRWLAFSDLSHEGKFGESSFFWAPLSHVTGLYYGALLPIYCGGLSIRIPNNYLFNYASNSPQIEPHNFPTIAGGPISLVHHFFNLLSQNGNKQIDVALFDLSHLKSLIFCGEEASKNQVSTIHNLLIQLNFIGSINNLYVSAECPAGVFRFGNDCNPLSNPTPHENSKSSIAQRHNGTNNNPDEGNLFADRMFIAASEHKSLTSLRQSMNIESIGISPDYLPLGERVRVHDGQTEFINPTLFQQQVAPKNNKRNDQLDAQSKIHSTSKPATNNPDRASTSSFNEKSKTIPLDSSHRVSDIAIVGFSGTFPQSDNCDDFWTNLERGKTLVSEIPSSRWDWKQIDGVPDNERHVTDIHWGGFVNDLDKFDAEFYGISAAEAKLMDPMQRKLIEHSWKALEDAGIKVSDLAGQQIGVFTGIGTFDYLQLTTRYKQFIHAYAGTGTVHCMAANRVSFLFDFHGPSESIDTACSSSLVALHRAASSIRNGECDIALVSGANALICDSIYVALSNASMLSPSGICKTFDDTADGYVRGEGIATVVLMEKKRALRDRHTITATLEGTAVNHGGRTSSLTAPNPVAQASCIRAALSQAQLQPTDISYIEAHGTATNLGDPVEIEGLRSVFQCDSDDKKTEYGSYVCTIGSVKTNIGHLEAAAGISGLVKTLLAIKHKRIPAHTNMSKLNSLIDLNDTPFSIASETINWNPTNSTGDPIPRIAGISSFGFGGVNAHVIVREHINPIETELNKLNENYIFVLSAKNNIALKEYISSYVEHFTEYAASLKPEDIQYTTCHGREVFTHRLAIVFSSVADLENKLLYCQKDSKPDCQPAGNDIFYSHLDIHPSESELPHSKGLPVEHPLTRSQYLSGLAIAWIATGDSDHISTYSDIETARRIPLPTYPFSRTSYWLDIPTAEEPSTTQEKDNQYYDVHWLNRPISDTNSTNTEHRILILPDSGNFHELLEQSSTQRGLECFTVEADGTLPQADSRPSSEQIDDQTFAKNVMRSIDSLRKKGTTTKISVIDLATLKNTIALAPDIESIEIGLKQSTGRTIELLKAMNLRSTSSTEGLSIVCSHAQSINGEQLDLRQAMVWGLCKTALLELPQSFDRIIDIVDVESSSMASAVLDELQASSVDVEIALRSDGRYAPRLESVSLNTNSPKQLKLEGTYLVTGGLGTLGLEISSWLAKNKVDRILLLSRSGLNSDDTSDLAKSKRKQLDELAASGVEIELLCADVANLKALESVCNPYIRSGELKGIFHLAGSYSNCLIKDMTLQELINVTEAKTTGTLNLQHLTNGLELDNFVMFSSAAAVWGASTGAHYSAGNYFMDAFATYSKVNNLPATTIDWGGLWEDSGIIPDAHLQTFRAIGIKTTTRDMGISQLEHIISNDRRSTVVAPIDWSTFIPVMNIRRTHPLFSEMSIEHEANAESKPTIDLPAMLVSASANNRLNIAKEHIRNILKDSLGILHDEFLSDDRGFYELGLDSLTSIDLKKKLQSKLNVQVTTTALFDHNTVSQLSEHVVVLSDALCHSGPNLVNSKTSLNGDKRLNGISRNLESGANTGLEASTDTLNSDEKLLNNLNDVALYQTLELELASLAKLPH